MRLSGSDGWCSGVWRSSRAGRSRWVSSGGRRGGDAAFVGLPGNPAAVYVTFARVVRPLLLRLAGAVGTGLMPMPVRAAFSYKKKAGRREYVRVKLPAPRTGPWKRSSMPRRVLESSPPSLRPTVSSSCRKRPPGSSPAQAWAFSPTRPWWVRSDSHRRGDERGFDWFLESVDHDHRANCRSPRRQGRRPEKCA